MTTSPRASQGTTFALIGFAIVGHVLLGRLLAREVRRMEFDERRRKA